jgi:phosphoribosylglycinamide formyltransferase 1
MSAGPARLVVLISGSGTNLQALLDACAAGTLPAQVAAVFSNLPDAYGLQRAKVAGAPAICLPKMSDQPRRSYDAQLAERVAAYRPDWVLLLGWMRLLSSAFLERFPNRVINLHPALPAAYPGTHAIQRAFEAYQQGLITHTGVMVHRVPDEQVDSGPVLGQAEVPIYPDDTLQTLEARIHHTEHQLLIRVLQQMIPIPR